MPGLDDLARIKAQKLKIKQKLVLSKLQTEAPTLFWAMTYHVDTGGHPLEFRDVPYLVHLYRNIHAWEHFVAIKAAQVGITEMLYLNNLREAADGLSVFYVFPKYELRNRFVSNRVIRTLKRVPFYRTKVQQAAEIGGTERMSLIHFGMGGIAFVGSNVEDEFLEIPVDSATIDELDRCHERNLLMVPDRLKRSKYKFLRQVSNPTIEGHGIDLAYKDSSAGRWFLKCPHCGHWFSPDFFVNVVEQTGPRSYRPRNQKQAELPTEGDVPLLCDKCWKPVDRVGQGEWVYEHPANPVVGVRINQIVSPRTSLTELFREWRKAAGNKVKEQRFYNMVLGIAYNAEGAKIFNWQLDRCRRQYQLPPVPTGGGIRVMGIDVGNPIHWVIRERSLEEDRRVLKMLAVGTAMDFSMLGAKIAEWNPKMIVIDADPELHEVSRLKKRFPTVWSCRFQNGLIELERNKDDRHVRIDRTALLDMLPVTIEDQTLILPWVEGETFLGGEYYKQLTAPTRIYEENELHAEKSKFIWQEGSLPDHFFLSEAYCVLADILLPDSSLVLGYYQREVQAAEKQGELIHPLSKIDSKDAMQHIEDIKNSEADEEGKAKLLSTISQASLMSTKSRMFEGGAPPMRTQQEIDDEVDTAIFRQPLADPNIIDTDLIGKATGLGSVRVALRLIKLGWAKIDQTHFHRPGA